MSAALHHADAAPPRPPIEDDAAHILVVDDDARIRTLLGRYLGREGFRVTVAANAAEARARLAALSFDLLVVDVMMPGESGFSLVSALRETIATPVLMLTARGEAADRIQGFEAGADDYLPKPFDARELLLRIQAILRRAQIAAQVAGLAAPDPAEFAPPRAVRFGPFRFHLARGDLRDGDRAVRLTERERDTLRHLASVAGAVVPRAALAAPGLVGERGVDVQITRLRRKIEADPAAPEHLQTVRGVGYRLAAEPVTGDPAGEPS